MDAKTAGALLIAAGIVLALIGGAVSLGLLSWFGRLPGDLRFESDNTRVYIPLASMLLVSVLLSLVLMVIHRLR